LNVLWTFKHIPPFIYLFRCKAVLEILEYIVNLSTFIDFFLNFFKLLRYLGHVLFKSSKFFYVFGIFFQFGLNMENLGMDTIVGLDYSPGNHVL